MNAELAKNGSGDNGPVSNGKFFKNGDESVASGRNGLPGLANASKAPSKPSRVSDSYSSDLADLDKKVRDLCQNDIPNSSSGEVSSSADLSKKVQDFSQDTPKPKSPIAKDNPSVASVRNPDSSDSSLKYCRS